jgi:hypothetical protein
LPVNHAGRWLWVSAAPHLLTKPFSLIMKNLKITQDCAVKGEHTPAGTILENVDNQLAADLIGSGRAVIATNEELENRDPAPENRDPKAAKKAKETE